MWRKRLVLGSAVALCLGLSVGASQAGVGASQAGPGVCVGPLLSANGDSTDTAINEGGRFVAFDSSASNLVTGDTNHHHDVFVRDLWTGRTTRVSVANDGRQGNADSDVPAISPHGRFVAFQSWASNLVRGDTKHQLEIFERDRVRKRTYLVSVSSSGAPGNGLSEDASISRDGRFVAFDSDATNLVPGDTNGTNDIFVHDRLTGKTERVSVSSSGAQANDDSYSPSISADGRFVAFESDATNLVPGDTNGSTDIFVHDRLTGKTERVSVSSSGVQGDSDSVTAFITPDGRFVAFSSYSSNLAPHPTTSTTDTFVHDRLTGKTDMVSGGRGNRSSNGASGPGGISANGRFVVFDSDGTNLVVGDTNNNDDVFVRDRQNGTTQRVNCTYRGERKQPNTVAIFDEGISSNGRFVVFSSKPEWASHPRSNVFVVNRVTGKTRLVSVAHTGRLSEGIGRG